MGHHVIMVAGDDYDTPMAENQDWLGWDYFEVGGGWTEGIILKDGTKTMQARKGDIAGFSFPDMFYTDCPDDMIIDGCLYESGALEEDWPDYFKGRFNQLSDDTLITLIDWHE